MRFRRQHRQEEFEASLREHLDALYRTALGLTRNRADAEDLVQEAALRAFRSFHQFKPGTSARAWLLAILRNLFISEYRRMAREPAWSELSEAIPERRDPPTDLSEAIERAVDALPEELRLAISLFYVEALSYREIAQVMQCPLGTVMSRLHTARKRLQEKLLPQEGLRRIRKRGGEGS